MENQKPNFSERRRRLTITACILASLLFWCAIKFSKQYSVDQALSITYQLPRGLAFVEEPASLVNAKLAATGWEHIRKGFGKAQLSVDIDSNLLKQYQGGVLSLNNQISKVYANNLVSVNAVDNEIAIDLEKVWTKRVPVKLSSDLSFSSGFLSIRAPRLSPDSVDVSGPRSMVDTVSKWYTQTLVLNQVKDSIQVSVPLKISVQKELKVSPDFVSVEIDGQQITEKRIYVPVEILGFEARDSLRIFPKQVLLRVAVGLEDYEKVKRSDFEVTASTNKLKSKSGNIPVNVQAAPSFVKLISIEPRTIEVYYQKS